jgi:transposase-like protein
MSRQYDVHTAEFKARVVAQYRPGVRGCGFAALAKRFLIKSPSTVHEWVKHSDGSVHSLEKKSGGNRKRKLSELESKQYVEEPILEANAEGRAIHYREVWNGAVKATRVDVSFRTIRRYGKEIHDMSDKSTTRKLTIEGMNNNYFTSLATIAELELSMSGFWLGRKRRVLEWYRERATQASTCGAGATHLH